MHLNHLNLRVDDLATARDLFERCFGLRTIEQKGAAIAVLADDAGFTLVLSSAPAFGATASSPPACPSIDRRGGCTAPAPSTSPPSAASRSR